MAQQLSHAPVSKVPWVVREPSNQALKDSRFYKEVLSSEDTQKTAANRKLYSLINNAFFPLYLPSRYHSMDCIAIKNETKAEGHYWTHASHFLLTSQLHGVFLWHLAGKFGNDPTLAEYLDSMPLLSTKKKSEMFKNGLEQCKSSAEFLLDPWVLMQLPWHPVLLLQWTAGVLTEVNMVRLELVELYRWPHPSHQHALLVNKLFAVIEQLHIHVFNTCLSCALMEFHFEMVSKPDIYKAASLHLTILGSKILPVLKFVVTGKARDVARALKRMIYGSNFHITFKKNIPLLKVVFMQSREWEIAYNCVFSDHFWKQGKYSEIIGIPLRNLSWEARNSVSYKHIRLHGSEEFVDKATPEWIAQMENKYGEKIDPEKIFGHLEHLISAGVITNICKKDVVKAITCNMAYFTQCYYRLMELKANTDGGLRDEDAGVIYDVLYTRTKFRIADVEYAMVFKIFEYCFYKVPGQHQLKALHTEGPEMDLRRIRLTLDNIKELTKGNIDSGWTDVKKSVPASCRRRVDRNEQCPNLLAGGAQKVAVAFEDRIKRIVFNMFQDHELWSENEIKLHPDWQFVQYILPCFVASFLEFCDNDDVEQKDKDNYAKIVHELIKSFEVKPFLVATMEGPYPGGYSPYSLQGFAFDEFLKWQMHLLHTGLHKALGSTPKSLRASEIFKKNFLSVLMDFMNSTNVVKNDQYVYHMTMLWHIQVYRLFNRLLDAFAAAVPGCLPNLVALEMTVMAHIFSFDHYQYPLFKDESPLYVSSEDIDLDPLLEMVRFEAISKAKHLLGLESLDRRLKLSCARSDSLNPEEVLVECKRLSLEQLVALMMFYCTQTVNGKGVPEVKDNFHLRMPMDRVEELYYANRMADQVKFKLLLGKMFTRHGINFSEASYEFARKVAPCLYKHALAQVKDGRVQMQPCELTMLPIKHCRWCGLVDNDVLRLCKMCREDRKFTFRTWFCSDECERLAMDLLHEEEHARQLHIDIEIEKLGTRAELETAAMKSANRKKKKKSGTKAKKLIVMPSFAPKN